MWQDTFRLDTRETGKRRRSDREIFTRFPLYLVPTYPGDRALFESPGFAHWLPPDLPLARHTLEELMELDPPEPSTTLEPQAGSKYRSD